MAWELRDSVSLPGTETGGVVASFAGWRFYRDQFVALSREDAHGIFTADQLISLLEYIIQSDNQYTKYGSEVRTYLVLTVRNMYSMYVEFLGLVSPSELLAYYRQASVIYDGYNDIQGYIYQAATGRYNAVGAENSLMSLDSVTGTLVRDESKVQAQADAEAQKTELLRYGLYAGGGIAVLVLLMFAVTKIQIFESNSQ